MIHYLLPKSGNDYKANLHCHTTLSDGKMTADEVKTAYKEKGYSIVAFTDHNIFLPHPELNDADFLALHGFELDITEEHDGNWKGWVNAKACHICFVALDEGITKHPLWHRSKYLFANAPKYAKLVDFDENVPDFERPYTPACVSEAMRIGREKGFFVTYNHPTWGRETYEEYGKYKNMHAVEIFNTLSDVLGYQDYNPHIYDEFLRQGKKLYCVAADDNHATDEIGGGYVMIRADRLEYKSVADALERGNFYASRGPVIKDLWYDDSDNTVHITCSDADRVFLSTGTREHQARFAKTEGMDAIRECSFTLSGNEMYVRLTVFDKSGKTADTNAYDIMQYFVPTN